MVKELTEKKLVDHRRRKRWLKKHLNLNARSRSKHEWASIVGGFAVLASLTPNKSDDRIVQIILDIVNFLGANIGKAKNDK